MSAVSNVTQFPRRNPKIEGQWIMIDPAKAEDWLNMDTVNRPVSNERVATYAADMRAGKWDEDNGETLKIATDGGVLDGQHRLWAIIEAQVKLRFFVFFNVDKESFKTIDAGMARTKGQVVGMAGVKYANTVAAVAGIIMALEADKYSLESSSPSLMFQRSAIVERALEQSKDFEMAVRIAHGTGKFISVTASGTVAYLIRHHSKVSNREIQAEAFMKQLATGVYDAKFPAVTHPIRILREKLNDNRSAVSRMPTPMLLALTIKTWNAYAQGRTVTASGLRMVSGEKWPTIV